MGSPLVIGIGLDTPQSARLLDQRFDGFFRRLAPLFGAIGDSQAAVGASGEINAFWQGCFESGDPLEVADGGLGEACFPAEGGVGQGRSLDAAGRAINRDCKESSMVLRRDEGTPRWNFQRFGVLCDCFKGGFVG